MKENNKSKFFEVQNIRYFNFWILGLWFVLRILDLTFSVINVLLGLAYEVNPIANIVGFNFIWGLIAFTPIVLLLIINYKLSNRKDYLSAIFFGSFILTIIQVIATFIAMFGWIFI